MLLGLLLAPLAHAFCGVYVGSDQPPQNRDSSAVLTVYDGRTTLTVASDFVGRDSADFGLLIPIPSGVSPSDVKTIPMFELDRLEDFTAPRTAMYDCSTIQTGNLAATGGCGGLMPQMNTVWDSDGLAVEALDVERFTVGAYDVAILEGDDAGPLLDWLDDNGFVVPAAAEGPVSEWLELGGGLLAARIIDGGTAGILDPLQMSWPGRDLSMPMVLGTTASAGVQDFLMHVILPEDDGAAAISNYPRVDVQGDCLLQDELAPTYEALMDEALVPVEGRAPWTREYVGPVNTQDGGTCDPCVDASDGIGLTLQAMGFREGTATVSRIRMRYGPDEVDEDLLIRATEDTEPHLQRYILAPEVIEAYEKWPVCGEEEPEVPMELTATCADSQTIGGGSGPTQTATCAIPGAAHGAWLGLLPLALLRRRR